MTNHDQALSGTVGKGREKLQQTPSRYGSGSILKKGRQLELGQRLLL